MLDAKFTEGDLVYYITQSGNVCLTELMDSGVPEFPVTPDGCYFLNEQGTSDWFDNKQTIFFANDENYHMLKEKYPNEDIPMPYDTDVLNDRFNNGIVVYYQSLSKVSDAIKDFVSASELNVAAHLWDSGTVNINELDKDVLLKQLKEAKQSIDNMIELLITSE